jgi:copper resistance protein B
MKMPLLLAAAAAAMPGAALAQGHDHGAHEAQTATQDDGQQSDQGAVDHSAHAQQPAETDPHAAHRAASATSVQTPIAGPPPEALSGPEFAADTLYGETAMRLARSAELVPMHGGTTAYRVFIERLEARLGDGGDAYLLDGQAWYGGDIDKLWLKLEGDGAFGGDFEGAELQALWSHAIGPWFDLQTGVRFDIGPGQDRGFLVAGVQGLAPYWIELDAAAFLSGAGDLTATIEAEHDVRITQRLILQPRAELSFAAQDIPERGLGAGLTAVEAGLRLRYELVPQFAPYLGLEYSAKLGETADRARSIGEDPNRLAVLFGIRAWF